MLHINWSLYKYFGAANVRNISSCNNAHGSLTRYAKLRAVHAPGMPGSFSRPQWVSDPDMHHGTCVTHVLWCMPGSLTSGFLWSRWQGKCSRHSRRLRNPQFYVTGKRPMPCGVDSFTTSQGVSLKVVAFGQKMHNDLLFVRPSCYLKLHELVSPVLYRDKIYICFFRWP